MTQDREDDWSDADMEEAYAEWTAEKDRAYEQWLMAQPDAHICNGRMLVQRIEQQWGIEEFERTYGRK